jgi:hypothetical protein
VGWAVGEEVDRTGALSGRPRATRSLKRLTWNNRLRRVHGHGLGLGWVLVARDLGCATAGRGRLHGRLRGQGRSRGCSRRGCRALRGLLVVRVAHRLPDLHDHLEDAQEEGLTRGLAHERAHRRQLEIASGFELRRRCDDHTVVRKSATALMDQDYRYPRAGGKRDDDGHIPIYKKASARAASACRGLLFQRIPPVELAIQYLQFHHQFVDVLAYHTG